MALSFREHIVHNAQGNDSQMTVETECAQTFSGIPNAALPHVAAPYETIGCTRCKANRLHREQHDPMHELYASLRGDS